MLVVLEIKHSLLKTAKAIIYFKGTSQLCHAIKILKRLKYVKRIVKHVNL